MGSSPTVLTLVSGVEFEAAGAGVAASLAVFARASKVTGAVIAAALVTVALGLAFALVFPLVCPV